MINLVRTLGQVVVVTAIFAAVAAFADRPRYRSLPPDSAVVKLSFTHGSNRETECRRRTPEELAKLPPNMRKPLECPRTRGNVHVELDIDGNAVYREDLRPSGISGDGPARVYRRFVVAAGKHTIAVRLRDTPRTEGFDYSGTSDAVLATDQNFVIDFRPEARGFVFR